MEKFDKLSLEDKGKMFLWSWYTGTGSKIILSESIPEVIKYLNDNNYIELYNKKNENPDFLKGDYGMTKKGRDLAKSMEPY